jgi:hypothetical protein
MMRGGETQVGLMVVLAEVTATYLLSTDVLHPEGETIE